MFFCNQINLGCHWSHGKTLHDTIHSAYCSGCYTPQIFMGTPYSPTRKKYSDGDIAATNELLQQTGQNVFTHLPYVYNLAGSAKKNRLAFDGDDEVTSYTLKCCESIGQEIQTLDKLHCYKKGCVLHIGSSGDPRGLKTVAASINAINLSNSCPLLLETMVGRGNVLGKTFEELRQVYEAVEDKEGVGFCIDTCHIFSQGLYRMHDEADIDRLFEDMDRVLGRKKIGLVHLNDSSKNFKSCKDRHALVGRGMIWGSRRKPLKYLIKRFTDWDVPLVLETAESDLKVVHAL